MIYRSTIYRSIDRDKQEKKEAESRRKVDKVELVLQLSWLERYTDNVEVGSSTLPGTTKLKNEGMTRQRNAAILDNLLFISIYTSIDG